MPSSHMIRMRPQKKRRISRRFFRKETCGGKEGWNVRHRLFWALAGLLAIPYSSALAWTGAAPAQGIEAASQAQDTRERMIRLDRGDGENTMTVEEYLPGVLARQIPWDYHEEALKAQAVIARTYIYKIMEAGSGEAEKQEIAESALDLDYLGEDQLKKLWGSDQFPAVYQRLETAVKETAGMVMTYEEVYMDPMFFGASSGTTRQGDESRPYLQPAACPDDRESLDFSEIKVFKAEEFAEKINSIPREEGAVLISSEQIPESIQIISRDDGGYVEQLQIGGVDFTGDQVSYSLGLASPCFVLEPSDGGVQARSQGRGHGYGLSQNQANAFGLQGWTAEEILKYFYKNIELISE